MTSRPHSIDEKVCSQANRHSAAFRVSARGIHTSHMAVSRVYFLGTTISGSYNQEMHEHFQESGAWAGVSGFARTVWNQCKK